MSKRRIIKVDALARVEGEGGLYVRIRDGRVEDVKLKIYEPPRFFEGLLQGRRYSEAPDVTARICGICPVAYQMSAVHAMEDALGITVDGPIRELRRLLYCGEWIESHVLHITMLHAPDFLGYEDAIRMAVDHRGAVERGLALKKVGNGLVTTLAGREIHPINVRVGGFYRTPPRSELREIRERLQWALDAALETVRWVATLPIPDLEIETEFVALKHPTEYPFCEGRIRSTAGLDTPVDEFDDVFEELHVEHSNALHARIRGRGTYFVGPQARYNLSFDQLSDVARDAAREAGLGTTTHNPFQSIIVRAVEVVESCHEAIRIIDAYEPPDSPHVEHEVRAGIGYSCTEAPRGILYHRYEIDEDGTIVTARIVPPTSQNQASIEEDVRRVVEANASLSDEELTWRCEQTVRNYDPCISCATHFLKLEIDRG